MKEWLPPTWYALVPSLPAWELHEDNDVGMHSCLPNETYGATHQCISLGTITNTTVTLETHAYVSIARRHGCVWIYIYIYVYIYAYIYMYIIITHTQTNMFVCVCMCMCVCVCVYIYIYIYIHIYTYIHIYARIHDFMYIHSHVHGVVMPLFLLSFIFTWNLGIDFWFDLEWCDRQCFSQRSVSGVFIIFIRQFASFLSLCA